jgi:dihydroorotate dehydrogenase electron transfer subunit
VRPTTDDGSRGHRGFVTDLLPGVLAAGSSRVYACGPMPMLRAVAAICEGEGVPAELALEAPMACGVGACLGCTIPARGGGYLRVCTDGPVFPPEAVDWNLPAH